ncbi:cobalamin-5'-phosphate synthase [Ectothiorhodosinus mongolicus]|uniref:Adenosylcobinamide-GDP ribazoletransferase n=1 Tax=Ectothiorhodosinus mongolicus TaxID=233100 RepID=A0A1R3W574_9GAMM|nr:adenosylcobinamide-GDP ribazoletransferase [Ectothiorhodosinus mongolicus]ULX57556.1 adenosylcobinamide-GDP ribazoletransferase [Ectothiorhodosinus mongolicus]SIT72782.1 cobalamin-5'-phosphate synthase [Ectothiorhodosinus mongolicus]
MTPLWAALRFLTRLPVPAHTASAAQWGQSMLFYPLVGLVLGILLALAAALLSPVAGILTAALLLTTWVWLTGLLHLDGLADSADALVGGLGDRERTLAIMKDPTCGPAGVITLVLALLIKFAALVQILEQGYWIALLLAPFLARVALLLIFVITPYVRPKGIASEMLQHLNKRQAGMISLTLVAAMLLLCLILGYWSAALWGLAVASLSFWLARAWMMQRLGGTTGDTAGALVELIEIAVLIAVLLSLVV